MESSIDSNIPTFKICGFPLLLVGVNLPTTVEVKHSEVHKGNISVTNREASDVMIKVGEKTIHAHKDFLASTIPFFRDLFNSNMIECANGEINLSSEFCGFNLATLEILLDYAYNGCLTISTDNVQDLMLGASFLRIESVLDECSEFIKRRLTVENIFSILYFCRSIAYERINSDIYKFLYKNFVYLSRSAEFLEMAFDDLIFFLKRDTLYVDDEKQIFEIVSRWIEFDIERRQYGARLLENVRWNLLTAEYISETVRKTEWVMNTPECTAFIDKTKKRIQNKAIDVRSKRVCEDRHVIFFGYRRVDDFSNDVCSFHVYDPITNIWTNPKSIRPFKHSFYGTRTDGYNIFFRRTLRKEIPDPDEEWLEMYNTLTDEWHTDRNSIENSASRFPDYIYAVRHCSSLAVIDGKVYMTGGENSYEHHLSSLETYDTTSNEWKALASMNSTRTCHCSEVIEGKLYVFGGVGDFADSLDSGECYDPETDRWTPISSMKYKRWASKSLVYNNHIYVFGGSCDDNTFLDSVERYDPVANTWTTLKKMIHKRSYSSAGVSCGKIFVFGSMDRWMPYTRTNTVEMYDPETNTWEERKPMPYALMCSPISVPASYPAPIANLENIWITEFRELNLKEELLKGIVDCGLMHPTKVQSEFIPRAISGNNYICELDAKGKTSSFVISTLQQLEPIDGQISVLILVPSREMASNIQREYARFSKYLEPNKIAAFFGGVPIKQNKEYLRNNCPHIVIGTPIRMLDLIQSGSLNIANIQHFVLDECDRMMGNSDMCDAVLKIFKSTKGHTQIMSYDVLNKNTRQKLLDIYEKRIT
ncbi:hypothetical protein PRIPAC_93592 [Pristionchus pacificus]|uniref:RNA helicase n=1 Tax=Pristionchus pacificus TaxID=54126 RepID=A0A2A6CIR7_PRIPA|nr:hypothetical protein PRIPAC_93592 [Pristionchus pacificus]|eukprot:PDM77911.1 BTB And C-terminal Kelch domain containing protein [Pristionchus pacificus]